MKYEERDSLFCTKLSNGLEVQLIPIPQSKVTALAISFEAGGYYEQGFGAGSYDGMSHFVEHMYFKGANRLSSEPMDKRFVRLGVQHGAFTTHDKTVFLGKVASSNTLEMIGLWGEVINNILIDSDDFEKEQQVVIQEEKLYRDRPSSALYFKMGSHYFKGTQLAHSTIGTQEALETMTPDMMKNYIGAHYRPDRAVISVVGDIDLDSIGSTLEKHFGQYEVPFSTTLKRIDPWRQFKQKWKPPEFYTKKQLDFPYVYLSIMWSDVGSPEDIGWLSALHVLKLGNSKTSLLYKEIKSKGLCEHIDVYCSVYPTLSYNAMVLMAKPDNVAKVYDIILESAIRRIRETKLSQAEFDRLKMECIGQMVRHSEDVRSRATDQITRTMLLGRRKSLQEHIMDIRQLELEEMRELIHKQYDRWTCGIYAIGDVPEEWEPVTRLE